MSTTTTRPRRQRRADPTYCPDRPRVPTMERECEAREAAGIKNLPGHSDTFAPWDLISKPAQK